MMYGILGRSPDQSRGILCALLAVFLWATVGVVYKLTLSRLDSFTVTIMVGVIATVILGLRVLAQGKVPVLIQEFQRKPWFFCITGIIGTGVEQLFYMKGFQTLPAAQAIILLYFYPLLMVIFAAIGFREPLSLRTGLLTLVGMGGVMGAVSSNQSFHFSWSGGISAPLLAACFWALFSVLIKHSCFDIDCGMFLFNLFGVLFLCGMSPAFGLTLEFTSLECFGIIYLAILPTAIAFLLWHQALRLVETAICSNIALLTPLITLFLAVVILHEPIQMAQWVGLIILLGAILLQISREA